MTNCREFLPVTELICTSRHTLSRRSHPVKLSRLRRNCQLKNWQFYEPPHAVFGQGRASPQSRFESSACSVSVKNQTERGSCDSARVDTKAEVALCIWPWNIWHFPCEEPSTAPLEHHHYRHHDHHRQHLIILELHLLQGPRGMPANVYTWLPIQLGVTPAPPLSLYLSLALGGCCTQATKIFVKCSEQWSKRGRGNGRGGTHAVCKLLDGCRLTNATAKNDAVGGAFLSAFL